MTNLIIQYIIVGIIVATAAVLAAGRFLLGRKKRKNGGACCGCSMADSCSKPRNLCDTSPDKKK